MANLCRISAYKHILLCLVNSLASLHDVLKWSEELLLKLKVSQLSLLQELHGELTEGVCYKERHIFCW